MAQFSNQSPTFLNDIADDVRKYISTHRNPTIAKFVINYTFQNSPNTLKELGHGELFSKVENASVSLRAVTRVLMKVIVHWLFRINFVFSKRKDAKHLFKCWVDVNVSSWGTYFNVKDKQVMVLPFPLGWRRQYKFIKNLKNKKLSYCLYGYPYSLIKLLNFLIKRNISSLGELEIRAARKTANEIVKTSCENYYVMDDVEPFIFLINELFC